MRERRDKIRSHRCPVSLKRGRGSLLSLDPHSGPFWSPPHPGFLSVALEQPIVFLGQGKLECAARFDRSIGSPHVGVHAERREECQVP